MKDINASDLQVGQGLHIRAEFRRLSQAGRPVVKVGMVHFAIDMAEVTLIESPVIKEGDWVTVEPHYPVFAPPEIKQWRVHALDKEQAWLKAGDRNLFVALEHLKVAAA